MKKQTLNLIALLAISILMLCIPAGNPDEPNNLKPHQCIDSTHATCDGNCECDGLGCNYSTLKQ